jgi:ribonuclease P protein component
MLNHRFRFHGHKSLRFLFRNGKTVRSRYLSIKTLNNPRRYHSRVSVIVSKKIIKSAIGRNRARRRIFEVVRKNWHNFPTSRDVSITVHSPEVNNISWEELTDEIMEAVN